MEIAHKKKENRGGVRKGAGRPTKADEDRVRTMSVGAITKMFGSEQEGWEHIANLAKESYPHLKLLYDYAYGKPVETKVTRTEDQRMFSEDNPDGE